MFSRRRGKANRCAHDSRFWGETPEAIEGRNEHAIAKGQLRAGSARCQDPFKVTFKRLSVPLDDVITKQVAANRATLIRNETISRLRSAAEHA